MKVKVKVINKSSNPLPEYKTSGSAGCDVYSNENVTLAPKEIKIVSTGLFVEIPEGYEIQVRPRSGLSWSTKLRIANSPGTVDSDYRNEVGIIVENTGDIPMTFFKGERIAQFVLKEVLQADWEEVEELSSTERGLGGFGSTNI